MAVRLVNVKVTHYFLQNRGQNTVCVPLIKALGSYCDLVVDSRVLSPLNASPPLWR